MSRRLLCLALVLLLGLQLFALLRAPAMWLPASIAVHLDRAGEVTLTSSQLAAIQAEGMRMTLRRAADGAWRIRAAGEGRPPLLRRDGTDERLGTVDVSKLRTFQVGGKAWTVEQTGDGAIAFTEGQSHWRYDGATVHRDGTAQPSCPAASLSVRALALWNRLMPSALTVARPLVFGGNLHCGNRIGVAEIEPGSAQIMRQRDALVLASAIGSPTVVLAGAASLRDDERSLHGVEALTLGRTRYQVDLHGDLLTLSPARRVALFAVPETTLPPQVAWQWRQRALWQGSPVVWVLTLAAAAALIAIAVLTPPAPRRRGNILGPVHVARQARSRAGLLVRHLHGPAAALVLAAGVAAVLLQRAGTPPSAACSLLLAACALGCWLLPGRATSPAASAALVLLGVGLLCQLDLGLGGGDTEWLRYYRKTTALLAAGSGAVALWHIYGRGVTVSQRRIEWLLAGAAGFALLALAAQVLWGDETGVFDIQPVEPAKLVLTLLTAHCLALRMGWRADHRAQPGHGARWLRLIAPALLFLALLGCALVQVDDYSPLILLSLWTGAMLLAYAISAKRWLAAGTLACVAIAGIAGVTALREAGPERLSALPSSFYADRFQVWLEPARHPHTGQQLQQGAAAIADGGWFGTDGLFGLRALGQPAGGVMALPAVQDDFAPSFLLHRHGLLAALLLWCAQAVLVAGLAHAGIRCGVAAAAAGGFRQAWLLRLQAFTLCGGAAFVGGHLLLSWGTNLAILPVMGQPMSFLSAGGSHLLFFLLPLLAIHAGATPPASLQE
ncbi:cell division protein FtsW [Pseudoduganella lurida]|uniref:Probable peptidoglycan glycosyltransferase FtsW n=1 Tax=Pseudoduganella lurida TaxID=1036180 RepID=A0A562RKM7_9BURK|nr:FtsW/RodA/SpoVE family cell cycle protein [Pseudoduganella lurida]TWI69561.1 cell division protein FtsW [Pseudoduganella lurida]